MICAGPLAAALVVADADEAALDELADGAEFEPHAPTIAATTTPPNTIGSAFDVALLVPTMTFRPPLTPSP
jgi:hypothetical protein